MEVGDGRLVLVYGWLPLQLSKLGMRVGQIQDSEGSQRYVIWWRLPHQPPASLLQFSPVNWERNTCFTGLPGEASEVVYNHRALCSGESKHSTVAIKEMKLLLMVSLFFF